MQVPRAFICDWHPATVNDPLGSQVIVGFDPPQAFKASNWAAHLDSIEAQPCSHSVSLAGPSGHFAATVAGQ